MKVENVTPPSADLRQNNTPKSLTVKGSSPSRDKPTDLMTFVQSLTNGATLVPQDRPSKAAGHATSSTHQNRSNNNNGSTSFEIRHNAVNVNNVKGANHTKIQLPQFRSASVTQEHAPTQQNPYPGYTPNSMRSPLQVRSLHHQQQQQNHVKNDRKSNRGGQHHQTTTEQDGVKSSYSSAYLQSDRNSLNPNNPPTPSSAALISPKTKLGKTSFETYAVIQMNSKTNNGTLNKDLSAFLPTRDSVVMNSNDDMPERHYGDTNRSSTQRGPNMKGVAHNDYGGSYIESAMVDTRMKTQGSDKNSQERESLALDQLQDSLLIGENSTQEQQSTTSPIHNNFRAKPQGVAIQKDHVVQDKSAQEMRIEEDHLEYNSQTLAQEPPFVKLQKTRIDFEELDNLGNFDHSIVMYQPPLLQSIVEKPVSLQSKAKGRNKRKHSQQQSTIQPNSIKQDQQDFSNVINSHDNSNHDTLAQQASYHKSATPTIMGHTQKTASALYFHHRSLMNQEKDHGNAEVVNKAQIADQQYKVYTIDNKKQNQSNTAQPQQKLGKNRNQHRRLASTVSTQHGALSSQQYSQLQQQQENNHGEVFSSSILSTPRPVLSQCSGVTIEQAVENQLKLLNSKSKNNNMQVAIISSSKRSKSQLNESGDQNKTISAVQVDKDSKSVVPNTIDMNAGIDLSQTAHLGQQLYKMDNQVQQTSKFAHKNGRGHFQLLQMKDPLILERHEVQLHKQQQQQQQLQMQQLHRQMEQMKHKFIGYAPQQHQQQPYTKVNKVSINPRGGKRRRNIKIGKKVNTNTMKLNDELEVQSLLNQKENKKNGAKNQQYVRAQTPQAAASHEIKVKIQYNNSLIGGVNKNTVIADRNSVFGGRRLASQNGQRPRNQNQRIQVANGPKPRGALNLSNKLQSFLSGPIMIDNNGEQGLRSSSGYHLHGGASTMTHSRYMNPPMIHPNRHRGSQIEENATNVEEVQRQSRSRSKNSEAAGTTWQVVQQKSAVKQFLGFRKNPEQEGSILSHGNLQKGSNLLSKAAINRMDEKQNGLRQSQSTNFNLQGHTMAINEQGDYHNSYSRNQIQYQTVNVSRARTPLEIQNDFIEETQALTAGSFNFDSKDCVNRVSRNEINNNIYRTVDHMHIKNHNSDKKVWRNKKNNDDHNQSPANQDSMVNLREANAQSSPFNVPIQVKFRHSFLKKDISKKIPAKQSTNVNNYHGSVMQRARTGSRQNHRRSVMQSRDASTYSPTQGREDDSSVRKAEHHENLQPRKIPGVSASLNKGVLPRQHKHIKQVITMIAQQQDQIGGQELQTINSNLIKQASNVNTVHQRMKENAKLIQEETNVLANQLALTQQQSSQALQTTPRTYNPIGDALHQARYSHDKSILEVKNQQLKMYMADKFCNGGGPQTPYYEMSPDQNNRELLISEKIEGQKRVLDATKLKSVLQEQNKQRGASNKNHEQQSIMSSTEYLHQNAVANSPFTKTQDFYNSVKQHRSINNGSQQHAPSQQQNRVLKVYLNGEGEIDYQPGPSTVQKKHDSNKPENGGNTSYPLGGENINTISAFGNHMGSPVTMQSHDDGTFGALSHHSTNEKNFVSPNNRKIINSGVKIQLSHKTIMNKKQQALADIVIQNNEQPEPVNSGFIGASLSFERHKQMHGIIRRSHQSLIASSQDQED